MRKIFNLQFSIFKLREGFTLIEFLVVIAVLAVIGSIVTGVITFSIRGTNKTNTIENIRQSGNYAISQVVKAIEYVESFEGLSNDGVSYATSCPVTEPIPTPSSTDWSYIQIKPFNSDSIIYRCEDMGGGSYKLSSNSASLIDVSPGSQIKMSSCAFKCTVSGPSDIPVIGIRYVLEPKVASVLVEKFTPPITFETSVTIRNYQR